MSARDDYPEAAGATLSAYITQHAIMCDEIDWLRKTLGVFLGRQPAIPPKRLPGHPTNCNCVRCKPVGTGALHPQYEQRDVQADQARLRAAFPQTTEAE